MITKIEILADDVHVHFNGENSEIFPNIGLGRSTTEMAC